MPTVHVSPAQTPDLEFFSPPARASVVLNSARPHANLESWLRGASGRTLYGAFRKTLFAKQIGRGRERISRAARPMFGPPQVAMWTPRRRVLRTTAVTAGRDVRVVDAADRDHVHFTDRMLMLTELRADADRDMMKIDVGVRATMCAHALQRMAARDAVPADRLAPEARTALERLAGLALHLDDSLTERPHILFLPFGAGAFVCVTHALAPWQGPAPGTRRCFSVRTWLRRAMLTDDEFMRFRAVCSAIDALPGDPDAVREAFRDVAIPYAGSDGRFLCRPDQADEDRLESEPEAA
mgnify:CR=1 FL=1